MPRRTTLVVLLGLLLPASTLLGQFSGYTAPGSLAQLPRDRKTTLEKAVDEARWKVGVLRLDPWFGVTNAGWVDDGAQDAEGKELGRDFTATVGAGLRAYLRNGPRVIWAAHALPEYVYWVDRTEARQTVGRYGAGLFGYFNHLTVEATATRDETQSEVTSASFRRIDNRLDRAGIDLDLRVGGAFSLFAGAVESRYRFLTGDDPGLASVRDLDRDESLVKGGVRYRGGGGLTLGAGYQQSRNDFSSDPQGLSSDASAPFVEMGYEGPRLKLEASVTRWTIDPTAAGSASIRETTGLARLAVAPESRISPTIYYSRGLTYTFSEVGSFQIADRYGAQVAVKLGWRTLLSGYVERGTDDFRSLSGTSTARQDDETAWGVLATLQLGRGMAIAVGGTWTKFTSNLPGFDREQRQLRIGLALGRLGGAWD